jgi:phosphoribosylamine-glycine ligase
MANPEITVVYYPAAETPLSREELAQVLGAALDGQPKLLQAMRQMLGSRLASATVDCAQANIEAREAGHAGGRVAELVGLQHDLANALKHARELRGNAKPKTPRP